MIAENVKPMAPDDIDYSLIDEGIRDLVKSLNEEGHKTFMSCDGSKGHCFDSPIIGINTNENTASKDQGGKDCSQFHIQDYEKYRDEVVDFIYSLGYSVKRADLTTYYAALCGRKQGTGLYIRLWHKKDFGKDFKGRVDRKLCN